MKLSIAAIGQLRQGPEKELLDHYAGRIRAIGPGLGATHFDVLEHDAPKTGDDTRRQAREGEWLRAIGNKADIRVVLDENGKQMGSVRLARRLESWRDQSIGSIAFLIGGADGHTPETRETASLILSLGEMTWPHMLARVMLCEQIYRALSITAGHPYHRE